MNTIEKLENKNITEASTPKQVETNYHDTIIKIFNYLLKRNYSSGKPYIIINYLSVIKRLKEAGYYRPINKNTIDFIKNTYYEKGWKKIIYVKEDYLSGSILSLTELPDNEKYFKFWVPNK